MGQDVTGRRSESQDPRAVRTRKSLVDATVRLLHDYPVADLNVSQIVKEAGVSRQVFYQHFADRDALVLAAAQELVVAAYLRFSERFRIDNDFVASVTALLDPLREHYSAVTHLLDSPIHSRLDNEVYDAMLPTMRDQLRERAGEQDPQLIDDMARFYTAGAQSVLEQGIREHDTPEYIAQRMEAVRRALIRD